MDITHDDVEKILHIVDNAPHIDEIEFVHGDLHFRICRDAGPAATRQSGLLPATSRSAPPSAAHSVTPHAGHQQNQCNTEIVVRAPAAGIFRHSSLLEPGQKIRAGDTIGLVGTTSPVAVKADVGGTVQQVFPEDGELVEFDQILSVIAPDHKESRQ